MKLYIEDKIININVLRDLKRKFRVVFEDSYDVKVKLRSVAAEEEERTEYIVSADGEEFDCTEYVERIIKGNFDLSLSEHINKLLKEFTSIRNN